VTDLFAFGSDTIDHEFALDETVEMSLPNDPDAVEDPTTMRDPDHGVPANLAGTDPGVQGAQVGIQTVSRTPMPVA